MSTNRTLEPRSQIESLIGSRTIQWSHGESLSSRSFLPFLVSSRHSGKREANNSVNTAVGKRRSFVAPLTAAGYLNRWLEQENRGRG